MIQIFALLVFFCYYTNSAFARRGGMVIEVQHIIEFNKINKIPLKAERSHSWSSAHAWKACVGQLTASSNLALSALRRRKVARLAVKNLY
ncbi:MAG: hypothetical protein ACD_7C00096G0024 [uncultured bacterium]|nr:MAG: hypothetical protein ACD_7C00096G0024 [uncultured bacterium]